MPKSSENRVWTIPFVLISLASLVVFTGFQFLIPTLPIYITEGLGGQESDIGLVMGVHAFASFTLCFTLGPVMDRIGRKPVLLAGIATFAASYGLLAFATAVPSIVVLRLFTGAGLAATVAAMQTMIADIAPPSRRGEAVGYYGVIGTGALALGPSAGMAVLNAYDFTTLFLVSAAVLAVALPIALPIPETLARQRHDLGHDVGHDVGHDLGHGVGHGAPAPSVGHLLRAVRLPAMVMFTVATVFGAMQAFVIVYARQEGVENPSLFFAVYAVLLFLTRLFAGRLSDKFGRRAVLLPGVFLAVAATVVLAVAGTLPAIMLSAALMGVGFGASQVGLMTLTVDSVHPVNRGAALGYFQAAFEVGIGLGSIALGVVAQSLGYHGMFLVGSIVPLAGFVAFVLGEKGHRRYVEVGARTGQA